MVHIDQCILVALAAVQHTFISTFPAGESDAVRTEPVLKPTTNQALGTACTCIILLTSAVVVLRLQPFVSAQSWKLPVRTYAYAIAAVITVLSWLQSEQNGVPKTPSQTTAAQVLSAIVMILVLVLVLLLLYYFALSMLSRPANEELSSGMAVAVRKRARRAQATIPGGVHSQDSSTPKLTTDTTESGGGTRIIPKRRAAANGPRYARIHVPGFTTLQAEDVDLGLGSIIDASNPLQHSSAPPAPASAIGSRAQTSNDVTMRQVYTGRSISIRVAVPAMHVRASLKCVN
jgi:hypothetical protein